MPKYLHTPVDWAFLLQSKSIEMFIIWIKVKFLPSFDRIIDAVTMVRIKVRYG